MESGTYPGGSVSTGQVRSPVLNEGPVYRKIGIAIDNSAGSAIAEQQALRLARACGAPVAGIHAYTGRFHRSRFTALEPHLPERYQGEEMLGHQRQVHSVLIGRGLELISSEYLKRIRKACGDAGIPFAERIEDGKNTDVLIDASGDYDLMVMGAEGLGSLPWRAGLGSVARGMLRFSKSDLLIARRDGGIRRVLACIDGSDTAFRAAAKAAEICSLLGASLAVCASHDRVLHRTVFSSLSGVLSEDAGQKFRFQDQEQLHNEVIDRSLSVLYAGFLDRAVADAKARGVGAEPFLLEGKPHDAVRSLAGSLDADLIVVGRAGMHQGTYGTLGSNAERIAEEAAANILVVASGRAREPAGTPGITASATTGAPPAGIPWDAGSEALLGQIPAFARPMAVLAIERYASENGYPSITPEIMNLARKELGV